MHLNVPYVQQDEGYHCGPAAVKMLLDFHRLPHSIEEIEQVLKSSPEHGTKNADMVSGTQALGLEVEAKDGASLVDIRNYLNEEIPVVVNFLEPNSEEGHYAVVIGLTQGEIIFNDPANGPKFPLPIEEFERRWKSGFEPRERWLMVAKPKHLT